MTYDCFRFPPFKHNYLKDDLIKNNRLIDFKMKIIVFLTTVDQKKPLGYCGAHPKNHKLKPIFCLNGRQ